MGVWAQPMSGRKRKVHRTFSLSPEILAFLKRFQATTKANSMTAAVEAIIREQMYKQRQEELSARVVAFYDSITPEERRDEELWGEFAESELDSVKT